MTRAQSSQKIHSLPHEDPKLQSSLDPPSRWSFFRKLFRKAFGRTEEKDPGAALNKRRVSRLDLIQSHVEAGEIVPSNRRATRRFSAASLGIKAGTPGGDRAALTKFFAATSRKGDNNSWVSDKTGSGREGWLDVTLPVKSWQGVGVCDADERVNKLFLPHLNIRGSDGLQELAPLTGLVKLSLWENFLEGPLDGLSGLVLLKELDLSRNSLTGTLDPLAKLVHLQDLSVGDNKLQGSVDPVQNLRSLTRLVLRDNSFSGGIVVGLSPCVKLEIIDLSGNQQLCGDLPAWLQEKWVRGSLPFNSSGTQIVGSGSKATAESKEGETGATESKQAPPPSSPSSPSPPLDGKERRARLRALQLRQLSDLQNSILTASAEWGSSPTTPASPASPASSCGSVGGSAENAGRIAGRLSSNPSPLSSPLATTTTTTTTASAASALGFNAALAAGGGASGGTPVVGVLSRRRSLAPLAGAPLRQQQQQPGRPLPALGGQAQWTAGVGVSMVPGALLQARNLGAPATTTTTPLSSAVAVAPRGQPLRRAASARAEGAMNRPLSSPSAAAAAAAAAAAPPPHISGRLARSSRGTLTRAASEFPSAQGPFIAPAGTLAHDTGPPTRRSLQPSRSFMALGGGREGGAMDYSSSSRGTGLRRAHSVFNSQGTEED